MNHGYEALDTFRYGHKFWVVITPKYVTVEGYLQVVADDIQISPGGDLIFINHYNKDGVEDPNKWPGLIISKGQWTVCYSASVLDSSPVTVDRGSFLIGQGKNRTSDEQREKDKLTPTLRYKVIGRDGNKCVLCGRTSMDGATLHVDHIKPLSKGGKTVMDNLQTLCSDCNHGKAARMPPVSKATRSKGS